MIGSRRCADGIAADLVDIGVSILNPGQARANDLGRIKAATRGRMTLQRAIDIAPLPASSPDDVRQEIMRAMALLKPRGRYVCGPDQIIPGIPEENLAALWDTARLVGRY